MTAKDWDVCTQPDLMLKRLDPSAHRRKWVLFNCACCRRVWDRMPRDVFQAYVEAAERYALGTGKKKDLGPLKSTVETVLARALYRAGPGRYHAAAAAATVTNTTRYCAWNAARAMGEPGRVAHRRERHAQCDLLREIFGNPRRPVTVRPAWLTWNEGTVARVARAIYDECAFDRLPVLGDALEEAGCDNAVLLAHCRGSGPHVRGCWVVDLLLGKS